MKNCNSPRIQNVLTKTEKGKAEEVSLHCGVCGRVRKHCRLAPRSCFSSKELSLLSRSSCTTFPLSLLTTEKGLCVKMYSGNFDNDCFICLESWAYWLSPFNWSKNVWTSTRIVMVIIILVISFCCLGTIVKLLTCFKWCCSCAS